MKKIPMPNPIVNMNGDEMTRHIWALIISDLLEPNIDLKLEDHDLGLENRNNTDDKVTRQAAEAIKRKKGDGSYCLH